MHKTCANCSQQMILYSREVICTGYFLLFYFLNLIFLIHTCILHFFALMQAPVQGTFSYGHHHKFDSAINCTLLFLCSCYGVITPHSSNQSWHCLSLIPPYVIFFSLISETWQQLQWSFPVAFCSACTYRDTHTGLVTGKTMHQTFINPFSPLVSASFTWALLSCSKRCKRAGQRVWIIKPTKCVTQGISMMEFPFFPLYNA